MVATPTTAPRRRRGSAGQGKPGANVSPILQTVSGRFHRFSSRSNSLAAPPTVIVRNIDQPAVGCLVEAQSLGISVAGGLSIVGIENLEMAACLSPTLSTVHVPTARIGVAAAHALLRRLRSEANDRLITLPIE